MKEAFDSIENLIRTGELPRARAEVSAIMNSRRVEVSRNGLVRLASLARRAGSPQISLLVLNPFVRPKEKKLEAATSEEKIEYAAALIQLSANAEAEKLLLDIDSDQYPQRLLFQSFIHFSMWNYEASIPLLQKHSDSIELTEYQRLIGEVNLVDALVYENRTEEAEMILNRILPICRREKYLLFLGNLLQFQARIHLNKSDYQQAIDCLDEAEKYFLQVDILDKFFLLKWKKIVLCHKSNGSRQALQELEALKQHAIELKHWESVRDCDYHLAKFDRTKSRVKHLYFGSPYPAYRKKIKREFGLSGDQYLWRHGKSSTAEIVGDQIGKRGALVNRLFEAFCSDFYRPQTLLSLYSILFTDRYWNPYSSPQLVRQLIFRLRKKFDSDSLPLIIIEESGFYRLSSKSPCRIKIRDQSSADRWRHYLTNMKEKRSYSAQELQKIFGTSRRTSFRIIKELRALGYIVSSGKTRNLRYQKE